MCTRPSPPPLKKGPGYEATVHYDKNQPGCRKFKIMQKSVNIERLIINFVMETGRPLLKVIAIQCMILI